MKKMLVSAAKRSNKIIIKCLYKDDKLTYYIKYQLLPLHDRIRLKNTIWRCLSDERNPYKVMYWDYHNLELDRLILLITKQLYRIRKFDEELTEEEQLTYFFGRTPNQSKMITKMTSINTLSINEICKDIWYRYKHDYIIDIDQFMNNLIYSNMKDYHPIVEKTMRLCLKENIFIKNKLKRHKKISINKKLIYNINIIRNEDMSMNDNKLKKLIAHLMKNGLSKSDICFYFNVSNQTMYNIALDKITDVKLSNFVGLYNNLINLNRKELAMDSLKIMGIDLERSI